MPNPDVITQFASPDPDAAPLNITQLVALLNTLVASEIQGEYFPYVIQNSTPGVDDRDKAWIYIDTQGRPIEIRIWWDNGGAWRRIYNGMIGEVRMYNGNPATDFDTDGLGTVGGRYDGWHICNGKDGTPDLSDVFPIGAHMNNEDGHVGYSSGWQTFVDGVADKKTGGHKDFTLTNATTFRPEVPETTARRHSADGNAPDPTGTLLGTGSGATQYPLQGGGAGDPGNESPTPVPLLPPFTAIAFIIFVGYTT